VLTCLACASLALHATGVAASAAELVVDPNGGTAFSTLAGAVAAAPPGATIRLRSGIYTETLVITKDLSVVGSDVGQGAVLDGEGRRPLLRIEGEVACRLENLGFRRGLGDAGGAGLVAGGAVVDFINCSFLDNTAREEGGAVHLRGRGTWSEFVGCHFQRNEALGDAGALFVAPGAEITLRASTFFGNTGAGEGGAVVDLSIAPLLVEDCLFIENEGYRAGALLAAAATGRITGNTFFRNLSFGGATVTLAGEDAHDLAVTNNIFAGDLEGAGLELPAGAQRGCNVYFDNLAGPLLGAEPTTGELVADPGFCDFRALDLSLRRNSPASGRSSSCGRIGALDVGCLEGLEAHRTPDPRRRVH